MQLTRERTSTWHFPTAIAVLIGYFVSVYFIGGTATILLAGFISGLFFLPTAFIKGVVIPLSSGVSCPACGQRPMRYVGCISFGDRFYHCQGCGQRCKRGDWSEPWYDASGSEDDAAYNSKVRGDSTACSRWLPDQRDVKRMIRAFRALLAAFGLLLACVAVGLSINPAWGPNIGIGLGLGTIVLVGRAMAGSASTARRELWDHDLDGEFPNSMTDGPD
jgi:hypothetical protein